MQRLRAATRRIAHEKYDSRTRGYCSTAQFSLLVVSVLIAMKCPSVASERCNCPSEESPVCGSDGHTYLNECTLLCVKPFITGLTMAHRGRCPIKFHDLIKCNGDCIATMEPCARSCYTNRCVSACSRAAQVCHCDCGAPLVSHRNSTLPPNPRPNPTNSSRPGVQFNADSDSLSMAECYADAINRINSCVRECSTEDCKLNCAKPGYGQICSCIPAGATSMHIAHYLLVLGTLAVFALS